MAQDTSYFARTNHRNAEVPFGIKQGDRLAHMALIGKTGTGKSTLMEVLALQDVVARGFALLDPHGDLAERVWGAVPEVQRARVHYLNAPDPAQPYGYNPLRRVRPDKIPLAVSGLIETLKKLWPDAWGVRMEHVLRNSLFALLEQDEATLPDILRLYSDDAFRQAVTRKVTNPIVRRFWTHEFEQYHYRQRADSIAPIQNKLGALLSDPTLYRILVSPKESLKFRSMMDKGEGLIANLSKGQLGADSSLVLGAMLLSTIALAALSRADSTERRPFFVYVDEYQTMTTLMLASMLPELRKYGVGMVLANQHLHQLEPDIRSAVLGNAGTLISFRVGAEDAPYLAREFQPTFGVEDFINLPNHRIYLRLMIDGAPSKSFSATSYIHTI